jgi:small subunit ribosomal protein S1
MSTNSDSHVSASTKPADGDLTAELNAEIDAAMAELDKEADAAAKNLDKARVASGSGRPAHIRGPRVVQAGREHRTGQVVTVGPTDIFVEFGPKELGIVPRLQFKEEELPKAGEQLELVVDKFEASEGIYICSRPGSVQKADWELLEAGQVVEGRVTGVATGKDGKQVGLELEVAGHRAFMPASQVSLDRVEDMSVFVGEKMSASVVRVERFGKGNIVLSRRDVLGAERKRLAEEEVVCADRRARRAAACRNGEEHEEGRELSARAVASVHGRGGYGGRARSCRWGRCG